MFFRTKLQGSTLFITINGLLNQKTIQQIETQMGRLLEKKFPEVVFEFTETSKSEATLTNGYSRNS